MCHVTCVSIIIAQYKVLEMQGSGQECDDIAELEALWLSSQGQQRAPQSSPGLQATASAGQHCRFCMLLERTSPQMQQTRVLNLFCCVKLF